MLDVHTAMARGVFARIETLRLEHQTREAQSLWDWARSVGSPVQLGTLAAQPETPAAMLREQAEIQRGRLLLLQDSDAGYVEALDAFKGVEARVAIVDPPLSGERLRRVLVALSTAYSSAGKEQWAMRVSEHELRIDLRALDRDAAALRSATSARPPLRAADELHNHAFRLTRLAGFEELASTPESLHQSADLLQRARVCLAVSAERRETRHGHLLVQMMEAKVGLAEAVLVEPRDERRAALKAVVAQARAVIVASRSMPEVTPSRILRRQAIYGEALTELAACLPAAEAAAAAQLARVCIAPLIAVHEVDANYDIGPLSRYGDACALAGDPVRARRAWLRARTRLGRARPGHAALAALDTRLTRGLPERS